MEYQTQIITLVRRAELGRISKKVFIVWLSGSVMFTGRGAHMRALSHARQSAQIIHGKVR